MQKTATKTHKKKTSNKQPSPGHDKTQDGESNLRQMDDLPRVDAGYRSTREARQCLRWVFGEDGEIFRAGKFFISLREKIAGLSRAWDVRAATGTSTIMAPALAAPAADVQHKLPIAASSS